MAKQTGSVYRTARGAEIDMLKLVNQNEMTPAVGNMKVNARGDKLGPNGQIIQRREDAIAANTNQQIPNQINVRQAAAPASAPATTTKTSKKDAIKDMDPEGNE
jgi:hypothetical protein